MKMREREFEVGEHMFTGVYNKCMVCLKKLKVKEKIILCPIQGVRKGWGECNFNTNSY